ncbi:TetR family transcriptional regulator [Streptomyces sp. NPDC008092]|uniref:TetR family transcriptional regulator n=1 Tax=Streptomyces sp. NPDC008092 TaxID=3364808 RepID=UPI0036E09CFF
MKPSAPVPVRERARRAVREELVVLAQALFIESGYEAVTVEEIAQAAGMSRRTFFRYFTSKEELMLGKYDVLADLLVEGLAARPHDEPLWVSFRRSFDIVADYFDAPERTAQAAENTRIINAYPSLRAGLYERLARLQERWVEIVCGRTGGQEPDDPRTAALVGAAVSCLVAAKITWAECGQTRSLAELIDASMDTIAPVQTA